MIPVPGGRFFLIILFILCMMTVGLFFEEFLPAAVLLNVIFLIFCAADIFWSVRNSALLFELKSKNIFSIGRKNRLVFKIHNQSSFPVSMDLTVQMPDSWEDITEKGFLHIPVNTEVEREYHIIPARRGVYDINFLYYRIKSIFGLFLLYAKKQMNIKVEVFPDIQEVGTYIKLIRKNRLYDMGIHKNRFQGMGTELEYLRDYIQDDDSKRIEWKATARRSKVVSKVFQMESANQIVFVIDCGRMMTSEQEKLSALDCAVNSILMLSHIALKMGDIVSYIAFSDHVLGELPPVKGKNSLNRINHFITGLKQDFVESNYKMIFNYIRTRLKRRSLILFFSDLMDDINYDLFKKNFQFS